MALCRGKWGLSRPGFPRGECLEGLESGLPVGSKSPDPVVELSLGTGLGSCSGADEGAEFDEDAMVVVKGPVVWVPAWVRRSSHMRGLWRTEGVHSGLDCVNDGVVGLLGVAVEAVSIVGVHVVQFGQKLSAERFIGKVEVSRSLWGLVLFLASVFGLQVRRFVAGC